MPRRAKPKRNHIQKDTPQAIAERSYLLDFARFARGDPLLSRFEEDFATSMERLARTPHGPLPSEAQRRVLDQIARKVGFGCEPEPPPTFPEDADLFESDVLEQQTPWDDEE